MTVKLPLNSRDRVIHLRQHGARQRTYRCLVCARPVWPIERPIGVITARCPAHPELVESEHIKQTREFIRAYWYVSRLRIGADGWVEAGHDSTLAAPTLEAVTEWIETYDSYRYPGTTTGDLALAALAWERWGRRPLAEIDAQRSGTAGVVTRPESAVLL